MLIFLENTNSRIYSIVTSQRDFGQILRYMLCRFGHMEQRSDFFDGRMKSWQQQIVTHRPDCLCAAGNLERQMRWNCFKESRMKWNIIITQINEACKSELYKRTLSHIELHASTDTKTVCVFMWLRVMGGMHSLSYILLCLVCSHLLRSWSSMWLCLDWNSTPCPGWCFDCVVIASRKQWLSKNRVTQQVCWTPHRVDLWPFWITGLQYYYEILLLL